MNPIEIARVFVDKINTKDVSGLCVLMTEDHTFIDGGGNVYMGRETMKKGWRDFFAMVPDYWITVEQIFHENNITAIFGKAGGTYARDGQLHPENRWTVPAAWQVVVREDRVFKWQVYADNERLREIIVRERQKERS